MILHGIACHCIVLHGIAWYCMVSEIDISVSKLLGFETFANFLRVSVSVSENLVSEKKVSVSVSENLVSEKKSRYRFQKIWYRKKSLGIGFRKFSIGKKV